MNKDFKKKGECSCACHVMIGDRIERWSRVKKGKCKHCNPAPEKPKECNCDGNSVFGGDNHSSECEKPLEDKRGWIKKLDLITETMKRENEIGHGLPEGFNVLSQTNIIIEEKINEIIKWINKQ